MKNLDKIAKNYFLDVFHICIPNHLLGIDVTQSLIWSYEELPHPYIFPGYNYNNLIYNHRSGIFNDR